MKFYKNSRRNITVWTNFYYVLQIFSLILSRIQINYYYRKKISFLSENMKTVLTRFVCLIFRYRVKYVIYVSLLFLTKTVPQNWNRNLCKCDMFTNSWYLTNAKLFWATEYMPQVSMTNSWSKIFPFLLLLTDKQGSCIFFTII